MSEKPNACKNLSGHVMVLNQNKEDLTTGKPRLVRFDLPDMAEEDHTPTKVSFVFQMPSTVKRIETQNRRGHTIIEMQIK